LPHLVADEVVGDRAGEGADRVAGVRQQVADAVVRQVGDRLQLFECGLGQEPGRGEATQEFEHPAGGDVFYLHGQFGEGAGQELMQLIDQARALTDHGLESAGDVAEWQQWGWGERVGLGPLGEGVAGTGVSFHGIGLARAVDGDAVVLVALGVAAGDAEAGVVDRQGGEEGQQVVGVLAGGVEADQEVHAAVLADELGESLTELAIALGGLDHLQVGGGGLQVGAEEGGVVTVARGVDADTDGCRGRIGDGGWVLAGGRGSW
jgi:hypothetical protein